MTNTSDRNKIKKLVVKVPVVPPPPAPPVIVLVLLAVLLKRFPREVKTIRNRLRIKIPRKRRLICLDQVGMSISRLKRRWRSLARKVERRSGEEEEEVVE